jgi:hypothetical protein
MGIVPENTAPRISFYKARLAKWAENADQIGLQEAQVLLLEQKVAAAVEKYKKQYHAQVLARTATSELKRAMRELSQLGASMIAQIRAAQSTTGPSVYILASIPPPAKKSRIGAPGTPSGFKVKLLPMGEVEIKWKCKHPRGSEGTVYEIRRQIGEGKFVPIGIVGEKRFVDETLPAGAASATYQITAIRSTRRGNAGRHTVNLGVDESWANRTRLKEAA